MRGTTGYRYKDNYSHKALQWLVWMERELGHPIIHAGEAASIELPMRPSTDITKLNQ